MKNNFPPEYEKLMTNRLNEFTLQLSEHLNQTVTGAVKVAVNGKIDGLKNEFSKYIEDDLAWKKEVQPVVEFYKNITFTKSLFLTAIGVTATLVGIVGGVFEFIKYFMKR